MNILVKTAPNQDLYVELAAGHIVNAGTRHDIAAVLTRRWQRLHPANNLPHTAIDDHLNQTDRDGATHPSHGWTAATIPIGDVHLPRPQLAALADAYTTRNPTRAATILRNAGRVPTTTSEAAA